MLELEGFSLFLWWILTIQSGTNMTFESYVLNYSVY